MILHLSKTRTIRTLVAATLLGLALAGCTSSPQTPPPDGPLVDFTKAANSGVPVVVQLAVGAWLLVDGSDTEEMQPQYWTVSIADPKVIRFIPADFSGRTAHLNYLEGLRAGHSTAVITYTGGASPETVTYGVTVGTP